MKSNHHFLKLTTVMLFALGGFTGCESTSDGLSSWSGGSYYGTGFYDPWYYGDYHDHDDIIVTPPSERPDRPMRPEQPINRPSIPSAPRPMPRGGGGRR